MRTLRPRSKLFPYTTLFRSLGEDHDLAVLERLLSNGRDQYGGKRAVKWVVGCLVRQSKKLRRETAAMGNRSEEHTSELQSHHDLVCRLLLEKKKNITGVGIR